MEKKVVVVHGWWTSRALQELLVLTSHQSSAAKSTYNKWLWASFSPKFLKYCQLWVMFFGLVAKVSLLIWALLESSMNQYCRSHSFLSPCNPQHIDNRQLQSNYVIKRAAWDLGKVESQSWATFSFLKFEQICQAFLVYIGERCGHVVKLINVN